MRSTNNLEEVSHPKTSAGTGPTIPAVTVWQIAPPNLGTVGTTQVSTSDWYLATLKKVQPEDNSNLLCKAPRQPVPHTGMDTVLRHDNAMGSTATQRLVERLEN